VTSDLEVDMVLMMGMVKVMMKMLLPTYTKEESMETMVAVSHWRQHQDSRINPSGGGRRVPPPPPQKILGKIWHRFSSKTEIVIRRWCQGDARRPTDLGDAV
jgi:hypothetical protein